jgi:hypothetical protein
LTHGKYKEFFLAGQIRKVCLVISSREEEEREAKKKFHLMRFFLPIRQPEKN